MNDLKFFKNKEFGEIRVALINNKPVLNLADVCFGLGYTKIAKGVLYLRKNRIENICESLGITGLSPSDNEILITKEIDFNNTWITEDDLYDLCLESRAKHAKKFRKWVTSEVLPSIRKHGAYMTPQKIEEVLLNPDTIIQLATTLKEEQQARLEAEKQIEADKPKVLFAEAVENSDDLILVKEMAIILTQRGFDVGQNQLFKYLREYGYLCKRKGDMWNAPTREYEHLFKVTKNIIQNSKGYAIKNTPKINGRGQLYFMKKFDEYIKQNLTINDLLKNKKEAI